MTPGDSSTVERGTVLIRAARGLALGLVIGLETEIHCIFGFGGLAMTARG